MKPSMYGERRGGLLCLAVMAVLLMLAAPARAQWEQQRVTLQPGWNAVFLTVDPDPAACAAQFEERPVASCWAWNPTAPGPQYLRNPSDLLPDQPEWLKWFPEEHPQAFLTDLHVLKGGRSYLVQVRGEESWEWTLTGRALAPRLQWSSDAFSLFGGFLRGAEAPSFEAFFAGSAAHAGQPVFRLNAAGEWVEIADLAQERLRPGEAYWVRCREASDYCGPIEVRVEERVEGLDFGKDVLQLDLMVANTTAAPKAVSLRLAPSAAPPEGSGEAPPAGDVALSYLDTRDPEKGIAWRPLVGVMHLDLAGGERCSVPLAVRRDAMTVPADAVDSEFQSLMEIWDDAGVRYALPVTAAGTAVPAGGAVYPATLTAGLWVGTAYVNQVSKSGDESILLPTATAFPIRLIVHVDSDGNAHLLEQVIEMVDETALGQGDTLPRVLVTSDERIAHYAGTDYQDGEPVGRRISSTVMVFPEGTDRIALTRDGAQLTGDIPMLYTDVRNPFVHRYHPDHDNLTERFDDFLAEGDESFSFSRHVALTFTADPPDLPAGTEIAGWGEGEVGGTYSETLQGYNDPAHGGINKIPVKTGGYFLLQKVSEVAQLDTAG